MASSNPFKKAAAKEKKAPGGENKTRVEEKEVVEVKTETVQNNPVETTAQKEPEVTTVPAVEVTPTEETPKVVDTKKSAPSPANVGEDQKVEDLKKYYAALYGDKEKKNVRRQFVVSPELDKKLKRAVKSKEIKSANHLVNLLLEMYFDDALVIKSYVKDYENK